MHSCQHVAVSTMYRTGLLFAWFIISNHSILRQLAMLIGTVAEIAVEMQMQHATAKLWQKLEQFSVSFESGRYAKFFGSLTFGAALPFLVCMYQRTTLGHWVFKSKSSQNSSSPRGACKGYIFAMEVTEELESWPEQATHGRRWVSHCPTTQWIASFHHFQVSMEAQNLRIQRLTCYCHSLLMINEQVSPGEAYQLCRYEWMREALTALLERLSMIEPVASAQELSDQTSMYMMLQASSDSAVALCWLMMMMMLMLWIKLMNAEACN